MKRHVLILGGTTEARELAQKLSDRADLAVTISLAGRTAVPTPQPVPLRTGGFGGIAGLTQYLAHHKISALIDATHPYATTMSAHAMTAARETGTPLIVLRRPAWRAMPADRWTEVADARAAAQALGAKPLRVFLAVGRQEIAPFELAPQHYYLIRSVDPVEPPLALPSADYIQARGPFDQAAERALLLHHGIDVLVTKNSGGQAAYGKLAAARELGVRVLMFQRPLEPAGHAVDSISDVIAWLNHVPAVRVDRGV
jgi:precorrin-6A/cobalt-precorrin-6A reductase